MIRLLHDESRQKKDDNRLQEYGGFFKANVHDLLDLKIACRGLFVQLQCSRDGSIVIAGRGLVPFVTAEY